MESTGKYQRLKARRGHKKAIIAIARMMLTCIYHMLQTGKTFNPSDYDEFKNPKPKRVPALTDEIAIAHLAAQGYDVSALTKAGGCYSFVKVHCLLPGRPVSLYSNSPYYELFAFILYNNLIFIY
jgi:hypothetical protein